MNINFKAKGLKTCKTNLQKILQKNVSSPLKY